MKNLTKYILSVLLLFAAVELQAQENLRIAEVFQYYGKKHGSTLVQLSEDILKSYNMTFYKSLSFRPPTTGEKELDWVTACIDCDKKRAKKIKETMLDGELNSGYYQLAQVKKGTNRFILFKVGAKNKVTLIYIEGPLDSAELVSKLLTKK